MVPEMFKTENGKIGFNKYKITLRRYDSLEKTTYTDTEIYVDDEGLNEYEVNYVPKHKLLEIVEKVELDTSEYAWMDGIEVDSDGDRAKQIAEIAAYGSIEAYKASLPESTDEYLVDMDARITAMELGLNE